MRDARLVCACGSANWARKWLVGVDPNQCFVCYHVLFVLLSTPVHTESWGSQSHSSQVLAFRSSFVLIIVSNYRH